MNCDQAFDAMTDAFDAESAELQAHLAGCPRCREMRETLSPALDALFAESRSRAADWPPASLPCLDLSQLAEAAARELAPTVPLREPALLRRSRPASPNWSTITIAALLLTAGAGLGWGGHRFLTNPPAPQVAALTLPDRVSALCLWQTRQTQPELAAKTPQQDSPRSVVLSCLACHLPTSAK